MCYKVMQTHINNMYSVNIDWNIKILTTFSMWNEITEVLCWKKYYLRGGKWLIHGSERQKDNQLQSLELPCRIS